MCSFFMGNISNLENGETMVKLTFFCSKCGVQCNGKCLIEVRKGSYKPFCNHCFVELEMVEHMKEVRDMLKKKKC
jgi:hypothetical protein